MDWEYYSKPGITIPVDTSRCGFQPGTAPKYSTPLTGKYGHWKTTGVTAIYDQDYDSFRVYLYNTDTVRFTKVGVAVGYAKGAKWKIRWVAFPN
jgi:hypothetical protein